VAQHDDAMHQEVLRLVRERWGGGDVTLVPGPVTPRPVSVVHRYVAEAPGRRQPIIVKEPQTRSRLAMARPPAPPWDQQAGSQPLVRPRLAPVPDPETRYPREYEALVLIARALDEDPHPDLGAVPVLGYIQDRHAIVMGEVSDPPLRDVLYRTSLGGRRDASRVAAAFEHAGLWLARYHALPPPPDSRERQGDRASIVALATRMVEYLQSRADSLGRTDDAAFLDGIRGPALGAIEGALPPQLPLALGHGDFALRNVLLGRGARVTVYDVWTQWCPPPHEDLATFLGSVRTAMPRVVTGGRWIPEDVVERAEAALLRGYGAVPCGEQSLTAYQLFLLFDRWGSIPGVTRPAGSRLTGLRAALMWRAYRREARRLLDRLGA
jgi:hypothetical protein